VLTQWTQSSDFGRELGCENNSLGGIATSPKGALKGKTPAKSLIVIESENEM